MGANEGHQRVPFITVNRPDTPHYREGWVRHHLIPRQCLLDSALTPFLLAMRDAGFHLDDFATNGVLLPAIRSESVSSGLPLHLGSHSRYNAQIIAELHAIRMFCESIRSEPCRRKVAIRGLRGSQKRARLAIADQRAKHMNRVVLSGRTDGDIDKLLDRLFVREFA